MADVNRTEAHGTGVNFFDPKGPLFGKGPVKPSPLPTPGGNPFPVETVDQTPKQSDNQETSILGGEGYNRWEPPGKHPGKR
jgi:hypothetical protein